MLEASGTLFGLSSGPLGALLGLSWALLRPFWGPLGTPLGLSWAILEAIDEKRRRRLFQSPPSGPEKSPLGALLGRSWAWALLGPSWASLGAVLGHLGAHIEASRAHRERKGEKAKNIGFPKCLKDFGLSRASLGGFLATWSRLGSVLEPVGGML